MDIKKVFLVSLAWFVFILLVFICFFERYGQIINYILSLVSLLSILMIIFGLILYFCNVYKVNK